MIAGARIASRRRFCPLHPAAPLCLPRTTGAILHLRQIPLIPSTLLVPDFRTFPRLAMKFSRQVKCSLMEADCFSAKKQRRLVSSLNCWPSLGPSTLPPMASAATTTFVMRSGQWIRLRFAPVLKSAISNGQSSIAISWAGFVMVGDGTGIAFIPRQRPLVKRWRRVTPLVQTRHDVGIAQGFPRSRRDGANYSPAAPPFVSVQTLSKTKNKRR